MINDQLINPGSIVVIGGSDDISKPGGKVLKNILEGRYPGRLYVVNPKTDIVQGIKSFRDITQIPHTDLAILAIPANLCLSAVEVLARKKETKAFIILSAGFGEEGKKGKLLESQITELIDSVNGCLLGPNCIGFLNRNYNGVFTSPLPILSPDGVDFISGSGATAVFIMEAAIPNGLTFSSVYSVGNSAQTGVEDVLEYLDMNYKPGESPVVKLLYIESIDKPAKLLRHALSLIGKGCRIAAIKSGWSEAGSRAASSHTGALASSDIAVEALFRKAGIVRCNSRSELIAVASVFMHKGLKGRRMGIITHAGGPAVMLTDALTKGGLDVPPVSGLKSDLLCEKLFPGSSVSNPFDFLATGTSRQLGEIIDACENDFNNIDAMAVIFGSPGLVPVRDVYDLLDNKIRTCRKPIFPILPSVINARSEIKEFLAKGNINFPDEVVFGNALVKVINTPAPESADFKRFDIDHHRVRSIIDEVPEGYLEPAIVTELLDAAGITRVSESVATSLEEAFNISASIGLPVAMKVVGPVHKSDVGGVELNITDKATIEKEFIRLMAISGSKGVLIQKMVTGVELFAGVKAEGAFGHLILAGLGGIFIEVLKDVASDLVPVSETSAKAMIRSLTGFEIIKGTRGRPPVNESKFIEIICRLSALIEVAPEITEMDINPLIGTKNGITAVDTRIKIEKKSDIQNEADG
jgi:acyl-CoA synthetase (NDP forming)